MVLADITGFTRLSERLALSGHEGAEQLLDAVDRCVCALLSRAGDYGGSLLKFGGDALAVWFDGDQHAARGCCAAVAMRAALRETRVLRAGATPIKLRMSVGVHSGRYEFFIVGRSHRELVVAGPAVTHLIAVRQPLRRGTYCSAATPPNVFRPAASAPSPVREFCWAARRRRSPPFRSCRVWRSTTRRYPASSPTRCGPSC
jgi:hypothetical protein